MAAPSPLLAAIGRRVRAARLRAGLTQEELAALVCLTRPSITNLEGGRQDMPITRLELIAQFTGTQLTDLIPETPQIRRPALAGAAR